MMCRSSNGAAETKARVPDRHRERASTPEKRHIGQNRLPHCGHFHPEKTGSRLSRPLGHVIPNRTASKNMQPGGSRKNASKRGSRSVPIKTPMKLSCHNFNRLKSAGAMPRCSDPQPPYAHRGLCRIIDRASALSPGRVSTIWAELRLSHEDGGRRRCADVCKDRRS
jgi:hypothetical protein